MRDEPQPRAEIARERVAEIPVLAAGPPDADTIALWVPYFSGTAETMLPIVERLAANGLFAVSFDPWQQGGRGEESAEELIERVFAAFRRGMWPILGQTTLDCLRVIEWARGRVGGDPALVAGGVSMGGDVAVALAGIDRRVERVAVTVATPDWTRPGMCDDQRTPPVEIDQGAADPYAEWLYGQLDPITHLDRYRRPLSILFACGAEDVHVPPDGALRFQEALAGYADGAEVRVERKPGLGHDAAALDEELVSACVEFLAA